VSKVLPERSGRLSLLAWRSDHLTVESRCSGMPQGALFSGNGPKKYPKETPLVTIPEETRAGAQGGLEAGGELWDSWSD
jgi:hypothetical protein